MYELENIHRQLDLLRTANQKLQDTNDGLVHMVDVGSLRSPRLPIRSKRSRLGDERQSNSDSDSQRSRSSRVSDRLRVTDCDYKIKRLMEDLDSGNSTLALGEDLLTAQDEAIDELDAVIQQHEQSPESLEQKDCSLTEFSVTDHRPMTPREKPQPAPRTKSLIRRPSALNARPSQWQSLEPTGPPDRTYKVVFAGDAAVGKTSFINRLTKGVFLNNLSSTLGVDFQVKTIRVDERNIALQLWDTAGD